MKKLLMLFSLSLLIVGCQEEGISPQSDELSKSFDQNLIKRVDVNIDALTQALSNDTSKRHRDPVLRMITKINVALAGHGIMLEKVEMLGADQAGRTVFFNDRGNKQLSSDFVPYDPRNVGGADVPYWIDDTELGTTSGMSAQATLDATVNTMNTWDAVTCSSGLNIPFMFLPGFDVGFVQFLLGQGGFPGYIEGTILHGGIVPPAFFDALTPGGGNNILGATFTFVWDDGKGGLTDIDGNGKDDVAIKEIYINDNFNFQDAPNAGLFDPVIDFETVVLHEVGHGLSQGHFGTVSVNNGGIHFSPAALMNAGYSVGRRDVAKTDLAGHCSIWGDWPNE